MMMKVDAADGPCFFCFGMGGAMGESNEVEAFLGNFYATIDPYILATSRLVSAPLIATTPAQRQCIDMSLGAFVDDLLRFVVLDDPADATRISNYDSQQLDRAVQQKRYRQNASKAEIAYHFTRRAEMRTFTADKKLIGKAMPTIIHLGGSFDPTGSFSTERARRAEAARKGFRTLGGFWFSSAGYGSKRTMFIAMVFAHILSGLESYVVGPGDARFFDAILNRMLRSALRGRAHQVDGGGYHRSIPNIHVLKFWRLPPVALELRVRRLLFFQAMLAEPSRHAMLFAALFGRLALEKDHEDRSLPAMPAPLCTEGCFRETSASDPWTKQLHHDMLDLLPHDNYENFTTLWRQHNFSYTTLLNNDELRSVFLDLDIRFLRSTFMFANWSPPTSLKPFIAPQNAVELDNSPLHICEIINPDSLLPCGFNAPSKKALDMHMKFSKDPGHGVRHLLWLLSTDNVCIVCQTPFKDRPQAASHLVRSWSQGRCIRKNTRVQHKAQPSINHTCPICSAGFLNQTDYRQHLVAHIPPTPLNRGIAIVEARAASAPLRHPPRAPAAPRPRTQNRSAPPLVFPLALAPADAEPAVLESEEKPRPAGIFDSVWRQWRKGSRRGTAEQSSQNQPRPRQEQGRQRQQPQPQATTTPTEQGRQPRQEDHDQRPGSENDGNVDGETYPPEPTAASHDHGGFIRHGDVAARHPNRESHEGGNERDPSGSAEAQGGRSFSWQFLNPVGPSLPRSRASMLRGALQDGHRIRQPQEHARPSGALDEARGLDLEIDEAVFEMRFQRGKETTRLSFALARGPDRSTVLSALRSLANVKVLVGQAPPNYNEEELGEWLHQLMQ